MSPDKVGRALPTHVRVATETARNETEGKRPFHWRSWESDLEQWISAQLGIVGSQSKIIACILGLTLDFGVNKQEGAFAFRVTPREFSRVCQHAATAFLDEKPFEHERPRVTATLEETAAAGTGAIARLCAQLGIDVESMRQLASLVGDVRLEKLLGSIDPGLKQGFATSARDYVKHVGVVSVDAAVEQIPGWESEVTDYVFACAGDSEILLTGNDALIALRQDSVAVAGVLEALGVTNPLPWIAAFGAVARALRYRKLPAAHVDDVRALFELLEMIDVDREQVTTPNRIWAPEGLNGAFCNAIVEAGGLISRSDLNLRVARQGFSPASANVHTSYSTVIEFACSSVFRLRGRPFDLAIAERLRRSEGRRSRWAAWGWLGEQRLWTEATIEAGTTIRIAAPADAGELLASRSFALRGPDRSPLGDLAFDRSLAASTPAISERYFFESSSRAIMEFRVGVSPEAILFPVGTTDADDSYPGNIDGCVLVGGRWGFAVTVDHELLTGDLICLPGVLAARIGLEIGEETSLTHPSGWTAAVRREPHAALLRGSDFILRDQKANVGDRAVILISRDSLHLSTVRAGIPGTSADLLSKLGIEQEPELGSPFSLLAAALGESLPTDRGRVAAALRRRGRKDLAELAESLPLRRQVADASRAGPFGVGRLCEDTPLVQVEFENGGRMFATPKACEAQSPLGLRWCATDSASVVIDETWNRWVRAIIRMWAMAQDRSDVVFAYDDRRWRVEWGEWSSLLDAFEAGPRPDENPRYVLPDAKEPTVPLTGLGLERLVHVALATGVTRLIATPFGWCSNWKDGRQSGPTSFREALAVPL